MPDLVAVISDPSVTAGWVLAVLAALVVFDAVVPALPSETAIITAGVLSVVNPSVSVVAVAVTAAAAGLVGDCLAYGLGHRWSHRWLSARPGTRRARALARASAALDSHGAPLVAGARFVAGGRTAVTLTSGVVGFSLRQFLTYACIGALLWGTAFAMLGRLGGTAFADNPLLGIAAGLGAAAVVMLGVEGVRRLSRTVLHRRQTGTAAVAVR